MRRILLVDDDYATLEVTRMVLEHAGFAVEIASNGEEALVAAKAEPPHIVITDFMMPVINGVQLAERMVEDERLRDIPVVLVSGSQLIEIGGIERFAAHLKKPVLLDDLLAVIGDILPRDG